MRLPLSSINVNHRPCSMYHLFSRLLTPFIADSASHHPFAELPKKIFKISSAGYNRALL
jgi:hypothetical protein